MVCFRKSRPPFKKSQSAIPFKYQGEVYAQHGVVAADSTFFDLFDFPVHQGNSNEFLKSPDKMLISPKNGYQIFPK